MNNTQFRMVSEQSVHTFMIARVMDVGTVDGGRVKSARTCQRTPDRKHRVQKAGEDREGERMKSTTYFDSQWTYPSNSQTSSY